LKWIQDFETNSGFWNGFWNEFRILKWI
jgi:hypothetical protein